MKYHEVKHKVECTEPSERLYQAVRLLYEYVLQRKHASSVGKFPAGSNTADGNAQGNHLQSTKHNQRH